MHADKFFVYSKGEKPLGGALTLTLHLIIFMSYDCTYCGAPADTVDHVTPISYNYTARSKNAKHMGGERVPCCRECNGLLGAKALFSVPERAQEVAECLERRYRKEINAPIWEEKDLIKLGDSLQKQIRAKQYLRLEALERIRNASSVAQGLLESAIPLWETKELE